MKILESNNFILGMNNSMKLLKYWIEESERKGTSGLKSYIYSLESNKRILSLNNLIHSFNRNDCCNNESEFDLELKNNSTIWDLKKILPKRVNVIP